MVVEGQLQYQEGSTLAQQYELRDEISALQFRLNMGEQAKYSSNIKKAQAENAQENN